jgi:hypothetical protein
MRSCIDPSALTPSVTTIDLRRHNGGVRKRGRPPALPGNCATRAGSPRGCDPGSRAFRRQRRGEIESAERGGRVTMIGAHSGPDRDDAKVAAGDGDRPEHSGFEAHEEQKNNTAVGVRRRIMSMDCQSKRELRPLSHCRVSVLVPILHIAQTLNSHWLVTRTGSCSLGRSFVYSPRSDAPSEGYPILDRRHRRLDSASGARLIGCEAPRDLFLGVRRERRCHIRSALDVTSIVRPCLLLSYLSHPPAVRL